MVRINHAWRDLSVVGATVLHRAVGVWFMPYAREQKGAIQTRVKSGLLIARCAFDLNALQRLIPHLFSLDAGCVVGFGAELELQVALCYHRVSEYKAERDVTEGFSY